MIEAFVGALIGASAMVLFPHFTKRLKRLPSAEPTYTGSNQFSAIGVSLAGDNGPKINLGNPDLSRRLIDVLPDLKRYL